MSKKIEPFNRDFAECVYLKEDGRINQIRKRLRQMRMRTGKGTWGHLFNTKRHARLVAHKKKLQKHLEWYIEQKIPDVLTWEIRLIMKTKFDGDVVLFWLRKDKNYGKRESSSADGN